MAQLFGFFPLNDLAVKNNAEIVKNRWEGSNKLL